MLAKPEISVIGGEYFPDLSAKVADTVGVISLRPELAVAGSDQNRGSGGIQGSQVPEVNQKVVLPKKKQIKNQPKTKPS